MMISLGFDLLEWMIRKTFARWGWVIMFSRVVLIRKPKEEKSAQYWDTDEQDWVKTLNTRKIGLSTCSAGRAPKPSLQTPGCCAQPGLWVPGSVTTTAPRHCDHGLLGQTSSVLDKPRQVSPCLCLPCRASWAVTPIPELTPGSCLPALPGLPGGLAPPSCPYRSWKTGSTSAAGAQPFHCQHELKAVIF